MKFVFLLILVIPSFVLAKINSVYDTKLNKAISYDNFILDLPSNGFIVLGEFHAVESIQNAQAQIIEDTVQRKKLFNQFKLGWEFLNYADQENVDALFRKVITNQLSIIEFLTKTVGKQNLSYAPIFQALKNKSGKIVALNIDRAIKQKLINEGEDSIKEHLPINYEVGGDLYKERFFKAMGDHVSDDMKLPYFKAQCLTDSVMSLKAFENHNLPIMFIVAGSFHTDFYQGTISRLEKLTSEKIVTLKIVDSSTMSQDELNEILQGDLLNGRYADFIIVTSP